MISPAGPIRARSAPPVEVDADAHRRVEPLEVHPVEPGALHHRAHHVGAGHRERAGAAGRLVDCSASTTGTISRTHCSASWSQGFSSRLRHTTMVSSPPGRSDCTVAQRGAREVEEHRAEAREDGVVGSVERIGLHVGDEEVGVVDPFRASRRAGHDEVLGAVDAERPARRARRGARARVVSPKPQPTSSTRPPTGPGGGRALARRAGSCRR